MNYPFLRAVVFDWDNTLVDSWGPIAEAMNLTRAKFGLPQWTLKEVMANCTRSARESFPEWFGSNWKLAYDFYYARFVEAREKYVLKPLAGTGEILAWLKEKRIPAFVVSNKRSDYLRDEIEKLGWQKYFVAVAGAHDAPRDKPAREHVDHALMQGGITADAAIWFVGDSETDVQCARNSGCTPVLIGAPDLAKRLHVEMAFSDCHALQKLLYSRQG